MWNEKCKREFVHFFCSTCIVCSCKTTVCLDPRKHFTLIWRWLWWLAVFTVSAASNFVRRWDKALQQLRSPIPGLNKVQKEALKSQAKSYPSGGSFRRFVTASNSAWGAKLMTAGGFPYYHPTITTIATIHTFSTRSLLRWFAHPLKLLLYQQVIRDVLDSHLGPRAMEFIVKESRKVWIPNHPTHGYRRDGGWYDWWTCHPDPSCIERTVAICSKVCRGLLWTANFAVMVVSDRFTFVESHQSIETVRWTAKRSAKSVISHSGKSESIFGGRIFWPFPLQVAWLYVRIALLVMFCCTCLPVFAGPPCPLCIGWFFAYISLVPYQQKYQTRHLSIWKTFGRASTAND